MLHGLGFENGREYANLLDLCFQSTVFGKYRRE